MASMCGFGGWAARVLGVCAVGLTAADVAVAQPCREEVITAYGRPDPAPLKLCLMWDSDGAGPLPPRLTVGGAGAEMSPYESRGMTVLSEQTGGWQRLGSSSGQSLNSGVHDAVVARDASLYATGSFTGPATRIARWTGTAWAQLGSGLNASGAAIVELPNGSIVVGGSFTTAGGVAASRIARWNGSSWSPLGSGLNGDVTDLVVTAAGEVIAAGAFSTAGGIPAARIARWNGSFWLPFGAGLPEGTTHTMLVEPDGSLLVGGSYLTNDSTHAPQVLRWNGSVWTVLASGVSGSVRCLMTLPDGTVVAGGDFVGLGGDGINTLAKLASGGWESFAPAITGTVNSICINNEGELVVAGDLRGGECGIASLLRLTEAEWKCYVGRIDRMIHAFLPITETHVIVGGLFRQINGAQVNGIARWDGETWEPLGEGVSGEVRGIVRLPDGDLVVGGAFSVAGGQAARSAARWDGERWHPLGDGVRRGGNQATVWSVAALPNGHVVFAGDFTQAGNITVPGIAAWDGSEWYDLGVTGTGLPQDLLVMPNGDLIVGGDYSFRAPLPFTHLAKWNVNGWTGIGTGGRIYGLTLDLQGRLIAAGEQAWSVRRWNGVQWTRLGNSSFLAFTLATLRTGEPVVLGIGPTAGPRRWDGWRWNRTGPLQSDYNLALAVMPESGDLLVGGGSQIWGTLLRIRFHGQPVVLLDEPLPSQTLCIDSTLELTVHAVGDPAPMYRWRDGNNFIDPAVNPSAATATLRIEAPVSVTKHYSCEISSPCGTETTRTYTVSRTTTGPACCRADWDRSGGVDGDDITAFFTDWQLGQADIDQSGGTDGDDISFFFTRWQAGC